MDLRAILAPGILLLALLPVAHGDPYGTDCSNPSTYDPAYVQVDCLTVVAGGIAVEKSAAGGGIGICDDSAGSPFPCHDPGAPASGITAAIFDPSSWTSFSGPGGNGHRVSVWVEYLMNGACGTGPTCGFNVLLCNDRDYDGTCTNMSDRYDQLRESQSNEAFLNPGSYDPTFDPCADTDKDQKDCGGWGADAQIEPVCLGPATAGGFAVHDWNYGQVVVFITQWTDQWEDYNTGAGLAAGSFDVWLADEGQCIPPECADNADNDGDGRYDVGGLAGDPGCLEADGESEANPSPSGPEPADCRVERMVGALDTVTADCPGATCSGTGAFLAGTPGRTVTCTVVGACIRHAAAATSELKVGASPSDQVATFLACGGSAIASATAAGPSAQKRTRMGWTSSGTYVCEVAFQAVSATYQASGRCAGAPWRRLFVYS